MSKERLEEIQKEVNYAYRRDGSISTKAVTMPIEHYEHLYEQAERVESLEENAQDLREALGRRQEQNKRYRESIEFAKLKIKDFETDVKMVWKMAEDKIIKRDARQILDDIADTLEALEGEE